MHNHIVTHLHHKEDTEEFWGVCVCVCVVMDYAAIIFSFCFSSLPPSFLFFHFITLPLYFLPPPLCYPGGSLLRACTHTDTHFTTCSYLSVNHTDSLSSHISFILTKSNLWQTSGSLCICVCQCVCVRVCGSQVDMHTCQCACAFIMYV